jgi:hypothetical protein
MNPHYQRVAARANHRCEYCHAPEAIFNFPFEVEHIVPPVRRGSQDESNLALACRACNLFKSDLLETIDSETLTTVRLFDPRHENWDDHFRVDAETGSIGGISPVGRATVERLKMNSSTQRTARLQWIRLGLFP